MRSSNGLHGRKRIRVDLELPPDPRAPAQARRALERIDGLEPDTLEDARLAVTELVANSVRHARLGPRDRILVGIEETPEQVKLEVRDPGPGFEHAARERDTDRPGGWGLHLVQHVASAWGAARDEGSRVWCVIPRRTA